MNNYINIPDPVLIQKNAKIKLAKAWNLLSRCFANESGPLDLDEYLFENGDLCYETHVSEDKRDYQDEIFLDYPEILRLTHESISDFMKSKICEKTDNLGIFDLTKENKDNNLSDYYVLDSKPLIEKYFILYDKNHELERLFIENKDIRNSITHGVHNIKINSKGLIKYLLICVEIFYNKPFEFIEDVLSYSVFLQSPGNGDSIFIETAKQEFLFTLDTWFEYEFITKTRINKLFGIEYKSTEYICNVCSNYEYEVYFKSARIKKNNSGLILYCFLCDNSDELFRRKFPCECGNSLYLNEDKCLKCERTE